ncbi:hypothetical protein H2203_002071 [Taxawa tesnikishii (nom. ined.)]|nr:hypothetical protein H2203_002071 [Dothideales sp. JES 119]
MRTPFLVSSLLAAVAAFAAPAASTNNPFGAIATRSGSPVHLASINANNGTSCPAGNSTSFSGGYSTLGLNVEVPGGQQGK